MEDARFNLKGNYKCHNWSSKINKTYYNVHGGNLGTCYVRVCTLFTPDNQILESKKCMANLVQRVCILGASMHNYVPRHPAVDQDLSRVYTSGVC